MRRIGLDPVRHFRPPPADRSLGARLGVLVAVGLLLFAILGFRLWFLQILSGESYEVLAMNNRVREVEIEAARGVIYDRDGEALVENRAGLSVAILPMDLKNEAVVVRRLADVLSIPEEDIFGDAQDIGKPADNNSFILQIHGKYRHTQTGSILHQRLPVPVVN